MGAVGLTNLINYVFSFIMLAFCGHRDGCFVAVSTTDSNEMKA